jgi:HSP20 family protein
MANITRRDEGGESQHRAGQRPFWDPFGMFSALPVWAEPFGALGPAGPARKFTPAFDVRETRDAYVFEADLPGISEDDFEVSVSGKRLSVSGKRESARRGENEKYSCAERAYGTFERSFTLSDDAEPEQVNAEFRDGVLQIQIAKRTEPPARRVPVIAAQGGAEGGEQQRLGPSGAQERTRGAQQMANSSHRRTSVQRRLKRKR